MPKDYYLPADDKGRRAFLAQFAVRLAANATPLEVTTAEADSVAADSLYFAYVLDQQTQYAQAAQEWTSYKKLLRDGPLGAASTPPAALTPPAFVPPAVAPGIFVRVPKLVGRIKKVVGYNEAIGEDLGVEGPEQPTPSAADLSTVKPVLHAVMSAGHPTVKWTKGKMDSLELAVDRGDGKGFVFLAIDTMPDYPDTTPLPAAGVSAIWKYRAIYRKADAQVGQWSDVLEVTVTGV